MKLVKLLYATWCNEFIRLTVGQQDTGSDRMSSWSLSVFLLVDEMDSANLYRPSWSGILLLSIFLVALRFNLEQVSFLLNPFTKCSWFHNIHMIHFLVFRLHFHSTDFYRISLSRRFSCTFKNKKPQKTFNHLSNWNMLFCNREGLHF